MCFRGHLSGVFNLYWKSLMFWSKFHPEQIINDFQYKLNPVEISAIFWADPIYTGNHWCFDQNSIQSKTSMISSINWNAKNLQFFRLAGNGSCVTNIWVSKNFKISTFLTRFQNLDPFLTLWEVRLVFFMFFSGLWETEQKSGQFLNVSRVESAF